MPDRIDGAPLRRTRTHRLSSSALALLLYGCAVYDGGLVAGSRDGGAISTGSGGSANQPVGAGGQTSTGSAGSVGDAGSNVSSGGSGGASIDESGGAGGTTGGAGTPIGAAGAGGGGGACNVAAGSSADLPLFQDGVFVTGFSTTGSWKTCNGTPLSVKVNTTTALAVDLSCNTFNGALIINWAAAVPRCTYSTLSFDIYFANFADISTLQVFLQNTQGPTGLLLNVTPLIAAPQAMAFNHVSLPIESFGVDIVYNGVGFFNAGSVGIPLFYVNNVVLGTSPLGDAGTD